MPMRTHTGNFRIQIRYRKTLWEQKFEEAFSAEYQKIDGDIKAEVTVYKNYERNTQRMIDTIIVALEKHACTGKLVDFSVNFVEIEEGLNPETEIAIMPA